MSSIRVEIMANVQTTMPTIPGGVPVDSEGDAMRLPQVRFTIRQMMLAVVIVGIVIGTPEVTGKYSAIGLGLLSLSFVGMVVIVAYRRIVWIRERTGMINSSTFDQQLALNTFWKQIGGLTMLPGTNRAADRFARASFFIKAIPQTDDAKKAVASVFSVIRGVSVPLGMTTPGQPNIFSTIWRTVYDHKNKVFFFDSATSPTVFWTPLADMDFTKGAPVKKLTLSGGKTYSGNAAKDFQESKPFEFLPAKADCPGGLVISEGR